MAAGGRLEARITFATNQTCTAVDASLGSRTVTVDAGSYYPTDLVATFETELGAGWSLSTFLSNGEPSSGASTGRLAVSCSNPPHSITWIETDLRDALGFTVNTSGLSVGARALKGMWLPGVEHKWSPYGDGSGGSIVSSFRSMKSQTGIMTAIAGAYHRVHRDIRWDGVPAARAMAHHESVVGESFESFYLDCTTGRLSYIPVNPLVRLIWDADVDATYAAGRLQWPSNFDLEQFVSGWCGRYRVSMPPLVVEV